MNLDMMQVASRRAPDDSFVWNEEKQSAVQLCLYAHDSDFSFPSTTHALCLEGHGQAMSEHA
jgi:hypothetical protein